MPRAGDALDRAELGGTRAAAPARLALAAAVDAAAVARAAVGAWPHAARRARVAVDAVARAVHARAVPATVVRAARLVSVRVRVRARVGVGVGVKVGASAWARVRVGVIGRQGGAPSRMPRQSHPPRTGRCTPGAPRAPR
eukprot:scaffold91413_cov48-Phaeocystis_antarctica.AAC.2